MLTLGWSDGHTFLPVDFALLSSVKSRIQDINETIDKRTSGDKRRMEALLPATEVIPSMLNRALAAGIQASYVLMDSWFTYAPLIQSVINRGLDVIGMVKADNKRYLLNDRRLSLQELYFAATPALGASKETLRHIDTQLSPGIPVRIVFVRHRSQWLPLCISQAKFVC
ncbi:hypothetical protein D2Q93_09205 [Alicyclobacillaceae bacterium I2511]|nr:hypothetical protein D2Q93_09205 [Alicyclobacillaceae bacterium I2511]